MGSESIEPFHDFFITANVDEPAPGSISDELIWTKFGGTIFPLATITVEPLSEAGVWWSEVESDQSGSDEDKAAKTLNRWRGMIDWFKTQPEFVDTAFVRIGDSEALWEARRRKDELPAGTEITGCVLPRLVLGLTEHGSLVGLFSHCVQT
jgi:hypothetical protein